MKKLIRLWRLWLLMLRDSNVSELVRTALYYLTRLEEIPPNQFSQSMNAWSKSMSTLQRYRYAVRWATHLPDDFTLIEDYPGIVKQIEEEIASLHYQPLITLMVPIYSGSDNLIEQTLKSVSQQFYQQVEICLLVDSRFVAEVQEIVAKTQAGSCRVKLKYFENLSKNLGLAFNEVLNECAGDFIGFLSSGDTISRDATLEILRVANRSAEVDIIYSDERQNARGDAIRTFRKPGWSRDLFLSSNYLQNFLCCRQEAVRNAGGFSGHFESDIKYDLVLRMIERRESVEHIPKALYQEEIHKSYPEGFNADTSFELQKRAVEAHLNRSGVDAEVSRGLIKGSFRVRRQIKTNTKISIIIPTRDKIDLLKRCIDSIETNSTFRNYEIIIIDNGSVEAASADYFANTGHKVVRNMEEFNYSRLNNIGARQASGDHLLFLNNDTEVIAPDWLEALLEHSQRQEVGAVGAKLLFRNGMIQHAGMVLGGPWLAEHVNLLAEIYDHGYRGFADVIRNFNCVTGACLMMRASVFNQVGGFDESLKTTYNDVDLCLKARARGYLVVYTPYALLYHHERGTRGKGEFDIAEIAVKFDGRDVAHKMPVPRGQARGTEQFFLRWRMIIENDLNRTAPPES
jgi:O-antigen biosynthesis protein